MKQRTVRIAAIALSVALLAAGCSHDKKGGDKKAGGTPVTNPDGTPVTNPDGTQVTTPGPPDTKADGSKVTLRGTPVTNPDGTPVTNPDGTSVTTPDDPETTTPGQSTTTTTPRGPTTTKPPLKGPVYYLRWPFAISFRTNPHLNPFPDYSGGPPMWSLRESRGLQRDGNYDLLPTYSSTFASPGISAWHADSAGCPKAPAAGVNTVGAPQYYCGTQVPPHAAFVYPAKTLMPVIAWTSNFDGTVVINGAIADFDMACGDGVQYYIDRGTTNLSNIRLVNRNATPVPQITTNIAKGESLYFIVDAGPAGNNACDATQLQITIDRINT